MINIITKPQFYLLVVLFAAIPLVSCASSPKFGVFEGPQKMDVRDYFDSPSQVNLIKAAERGDRQQLRNAMEQGADVNKVGRAGMTPLFWAFGKQNLDGYKLLLEFGADPNIVVELPESFEEEQAGALEMAARIEDSEYLRLLLDSSGNPNLLLNDWNEPLIYRAIMYRRPDNVSLLLKYGAEIDYQDKSGSTPLRKAVTARQFEIALLLLRSGADPTIQNNNGSSAVDLVIKYGDRGIDKRTNDLAAYEEFVSELKKLAILDTDPPSFQ